MGANVTELMRQRAITLVREVQGYFNVPINKWFGWQDPLVFDFGPHRARLHRDGRLDIETRQGRRGYAQLRRGDIPDFMAALKLAIRDRLAPYVDPSQLDG